jgi:hypothetical protein
VTVSVSPFNVGDSITTTVHAIGGRQEEVTGPVIRLNMSRKVPGRVLSYEVDAAHAGYGRIVVEVAKARLEVRV